MSLKSRIAAAEAQLSKVKGSGLLCIAIHGGLEPNGHENLAHIGDLLWRREANETVDAFQRRVREAATASREHCIIFGGLPPMPVEEPC
jgi:hypothetical protein